MECVATYNISEHTKSDLKLSPTDKGAVDKGAV
jgi:hypothetical protein